MNVGSCRVMVLLDTSTAHFGPRQAKAWTPNHGPPGLAVVGVQALACPGQATHQNENRWPLAPLGRMAVLG